MADALTTLAKRKEDRRKETGEEVVELETLVCGRNRLESGSMEAWARCFRANKKVKMVKMVQNGIRQEGIIRLLRDGLGTCEGLKVCDLQDNTFTATGAGALCEVLPKWKELRELGVGDCLIGARGAVKLGESLGQASNKEIEVLRLQYNEIDAKGVKAIWQAAKGGALPRLRRVELNGNKFSEDDEGVEGLRLSLEERKEKAEDEVREEEWGLDELSDLESDDDEDEEDEADEDEEDEELKAAQRERVLKDADEREEQNVAEKQDDDINALADKLGGTHV